MQPQGEQQKTQKQLEQLGAKIGARIDATRLLFHVFDDPRPKYVAKVSLTDKFIDKTILWAIPDFIRPNHVTLFRFLCIPVIIYFLIIGRYDVGFVLFVIAAISDAVDGALARTRNKITDWGIVFDPFADKILIGLVGGIVIYQYLNHLIAFTIIGLELLLIASSYYRFKGTVVPAKAVGKIKMILQCVGVGFIFLAILAHMPFALVLARYTLYAAIFFALMSIFVYKSI